MSLFRRREPLHVQLARAGGLSLDGEEPTRPAWEATGIHGIQRPRVWDAVVTTEAPDVKGDKAAFVALADGDLVIEDGGGDLEPLATALEQTLAPPYRAEAVRREAELWAVAGRRIEVVSLPGVDGDEIELTVNGAERSLVIDGDRRFGSVPALERPGHVVRARRIDGELWEVGEAPL
jgi:hypothetical protein